MPESLADKIIWITGASSGIGEALAAEYARYGARLVLSARREAELQRVRKQLVNADEHLVLPMDLTQSESMAEGVSRVMAHFGGIDQVVHNGGISQRALARDTELAVDRRLMEVNYFGAVALTKAVLPIFRQQRRGRFVVVTSLVGELPTPKRSAYSASKHALHGFFEALRAEEYDDGIRVTLVLPGFIRTNLTYSALLGDGSEQNSLDDAQANGMAAVDCARRLVEAVQRSRDQVIIAGPEGWGVYLKRWLPPLYRRVIRKVKVT